MDNVTAGLYRPQPFLSTVKDAWNAFLSSRNGLCQVDSLTAPPANATQREATRSRALREQKTKKLTARGPGSTVCTASLRKSAEPAYWPRPAPVLGQRARAPGDEATVACQKGGMYPTFDSAAGSGEIPVFFGILPVLILRVTWFDSAAGSGEIPVFFGILPYLILRVTWFDSASGPIPVNASHWPRRTGLGPVCTL